MKSKREHQLKMLYINAMKIPTIDVTKGVNRALRESEEQRGLEKQRTLKKQKGKGAFSDRKRR